MLADWGLSALAKHEYDESIDEMRHADRLIKRILVLGGLPNLQDLDKLMVGEDFEDVLGCDLKLELKARPDLQAAIAQCEKVSDYVSRELFVHVLESEEEHIDWLQTQMRMIHQMGLQNYVQLQSEPKRASSSLRAAPNSASWRAKILDHRVPASGTLRSKRLRRRPVILRHC
jgi:bacterioferritin